MKKVILTVGDIILEEEILKSDYFGGRIFATNTQTGEKCNKNWRKK